MGAELERWESLVPHACTTRARSPWWTTQRTRCHGYFANRTEQMADKPLTEPAEDSPAESSSGPSLTADAMAELQRERDDFHDRWLRKSAEFDNYRKRVERERREQVDQGIADLLEELLLVVDDFDRALTVDAG